MDEPAPGNSAAYVPVRALERGVHLLRALNRLGRARPAELARAVGIDRTTTYRMLATLETMGLVQRSASNDDYVLLAAVRELSDGFTERDRTTRIVATQLGDLFQKVLYPTDFATFDRGSMVIRETTHRFSPYSVHRAMVGQPRGLFASALGRAALAGAEPAERATMVEIAAGIGTPVPAPWRSHTEALDWVVADYAARGYAWSVGGSDARISAIALPVNAADGTAAAVNLVFFSSSMSVDVAAERYLAPLKECVAAIRHELLDPTGH